MKKHLRLISLSLLSRSEEAAREIRFQSGMNLIHGTNDVGKSTVLKSIFRTLGAPVPNLDNPRWKSANVIYSLEISVDGTKHRIVHNGDDYGVFTEGLPVRRYKGLGGENGFSNFIRELLNQNALLPRAKSGSISLYPAFLLSPFYIDQDSGWSSTWSSFDLGMYRAPRTTLIAYHVGLKGQAIFKADEQESALREEIADEERNSRSVSRVKSSYSRKYSSRNIAADLGSLEGRLQELTAAYNDGLRRRQQVADKLQLIVNQRLSLDSEVDILKRSLRELNADFEFLVKPETSNEVDCPTCGAIYENGISQRFRLASDVSMTEQLLEMRLEQRSKILLSEEEQRSVLTDFESGLQNVKNELLSVERDITFQNVVLSESFRESLNAFDAEIASSHLKLEKLQDELSLIQLSKKEFLGDKKAIDSAYSRLMKSALTQINVHLADERVLGDVNKRVSKESLGSELPRFILARTIVLLKLMREFNNFIDAPFVVDTPMQQEQDDENQEAIWKFLKSSRAADQQMIVGTTIATVLADSMSNDDIHVIQLDDKFGLLKTEDFDRLKPAILSDFYEMLETEAL